MRVGRSFVLIVNRARGARRLAGDGAGPEPPPGGAEVPPDGTRAAWVSDDAQSMYSATRPNPSRPRRESERLLTIHGTSRDGTGTTYDSTSWVEIDDPDCAPSQPSSVQQGI